MTERLHIYVEGIVQGVGFRPFVYGLARRNGLAGFVLNDTNGVTIELEGEKSALERFVKTLRDDPPPLAFIERIVLASRPPKGEENFTIAGSQTEEERRVAVAPDAATCEACLTELFDRSNRRYRYPFINCTQCGPRFTIVIDVPYDRRRTTMVDFQMCAACAREYQDPADRRFHAEPNACPRCGPKIRLIDGEAGEAAARDAILEAAKMLRQGAILALKGLGGYHLACNAFDHAAAARLRKKKHREDKPFALMAGDLQAVRELCVVDAAEEALLCSRKRPIVLLKKREPGSLAPAVAPGQRHLGLMLPYTPLHHLLLADAGTPLVMTSGNLSDEPIAYEDADAMARLGSIADYFLVHDRRIRVRCDDSVARVVESRETVIRRARGYAPWPIATHVSFAKPILACGAQLKNTFAVAKGNRVYLSQHVGDLENYEAYKSFLEGVEHFERLFDVEPAVVAHDLHPGYLSTRYATELTGVRKVGVQHHHAHIASCMAEHGLDGPVIGVAFDGLGYGGDGTIWGGEFLVADFAGYARRAHLRYVPLAGGDAAIRQPWRSALSYLHDALGTDPAALALPRWEAVPQKSIALVRSMIARKLNMVETSSCGRLFDAAASIIGLRHQVNYEGQAAIELEMALSDAGDEAYSFAINGADIWEIDMRPAIRSMVRDVTERESQGRIAAKFHNTLVLAVVEICRRLGSAQGLNRVCLSGGAFQNMYLLGRAVGALRQCGFEVFCHSRVPTNDGGIALGQAVIANELMRRGG